MSRHFAWSYNILFAEELLNNKKCCQKYCHLILPTSNATGGKSTADNNAIQLTGEGSLNEPDSCFTEGDENDPKYVEEQQKKWKKHYCKHREIEHTVSSQ
jgi:hypothetical protein